MQTKLIQTYQVRDEGQEAEAILRSCVHCGFCNATCPTYQILGDELDGPRGRIYQIKQLLEGEVVTEETQKHLDRCLTCRSCETTCPSGVQYHRLLDIGRALLKEQVPRRWHERYYRKAMLVLFSNAWLFSTVLKIAQHISPVLPQVLRQYVPLERKNRFLDWQGKEVLDSHDKQVLALRGCVQDGLDPNINGATLALFGAMGVKVVHSAKAGCCGAMSFHLDEVERAKDEARRNIDAWWPSIENDQVEAILVNASGCGSFAKEYVELLKGDPNYHRKAQIISERVKDPAEYAEDLDWESVRSELKTKLQSRRDSVVFHSPCSLQHGQKLGGSVERILASLGVEVLALSDSHLCCGSAGTYSILQPELSGELKERKLEAIKASGANVVLSANVGCQTHLSTGSDFEVRHWLDYLAEVLTEARSGQ